MSSIDHVGDGWGAIPGAGPPAVQMWHRVVDGHDLELLRAMLADDVVFRSPAVHTPQAGAARAYAYLAAALVVLGPTLTYRQEWYGTDSAVLEFTATLDGLDVHGVDMLAWDAENRLVEFTVMVRPFKALTTLMELMGRQLQAES